MKERIKKYLPDGVYGAIDGTVTTFAIIGGVYGAGLSPLIVLILGISNVLADGFSMAASNFLARKSEQDESRYHTAIYSALTTFFAFVIIGIIPLIPFIFAIFTPIEASKQFTYSIIGTFCAFLLTGYARGRITHKNIFVTCMETIIIGGIAASIAYGVGALLKGFGV
jgi:vacuolar iron transporter family protein